MFTQFHRTTDTFFVVSVVWGKKVVRACSRRCDCFHFYIKVQIDEMDDDQRGQECAALIIWKSKLWIEWPDCKTQMSVCVWYTFKLHFKFSFSHKQSGNICSQVCCISIFVYGSILIWRYKSVLSLIKTLDNILPTLTIFIYFVVF